jgi:hypothetical protein
MMMSLANIHLPAPVGGMWGFITLVLLILFLTLVVSDGSHDKEK